MTGKAESGLGNHILKVGGQAGSLLLLGWVAAEGA